MKSKVKRLFRDFKFVGFKNLFKSYKRLILLLIGSLFIYWGLFSFLIYPIYEIITDFSFTGSLIALVKVFALSAIFIGLGVASALTSISHINYNSKNRKDL
jgi:hypothetical protein